MENKGFANQTFRKVFFSALIILGLILHVVYSFFNFGGNFFEYTPWTGLLTASTPGIEAIDYTALTTISFINVGFVILNVVITGFVLFSELKKEKGSIISAIVYIVLGSTALLLNKSYSHLSAIQIVFIILLLLLAILNVLFNVISYKYTKEDITEENNNEFETRKKVEITAIILEIAELVAGISIFLIPLYVGTKTVEGITTITFPSISSILFIGLDLTQESLAQNNILILIASLMFVISYLISIFVFINSLKYHFQKNKNFVARSRMSCFVNIGLTFAFTIVSVIFTLELKNQFDTIFTCGFIPLIIIFILSVVQLVFLSKIDPEVSSKETFTLKNPNKFFILVATVLFPLVTVISLFLNFLKVFENKDATSPLLSLQAMDILKNYKNLDEGYSILAYAILLIIIVCSISFIVSFISVVTSSKSSNKLAKVNIFVNFIAVFLIGIFGKYYEMSNAITVGMYASLFEEFAPTIVSSFENMVATSDAMFLIIADLLLLVVLLFIKPFSKTEPEALLAGEGKSSNQQGGSSTGGSLSLGGETLEGDFDACPAFSELDSLIPEFKEKLNKRNEALYNSPNLIKLVEFIVDYAKNSRLHLSYTKEDIATFIAGLGATKLSILQGMSGTGKTSLPKIFLEAIMGSCDIVEVESSWKDKNELLGYYNEFSKTYTPKKFTQALYKAALNKEVITFIVLDEMNLSRIEYYFSDFLSLMENEEDKREIKLLNTQLFNIKNGIKTPYTALDSNHTIKIPANIWFIGTANRDESTFEISDKVYDRAYTMNFDKRAASITEFDAPMSPRFLNYPIFRNLLDDAKTNFKFNIDESETIKEVEKLLQPYNISFGNRIALQISNFVKVYCSCFDNPSSKVDEAIETILLSKVVHKLEYKNIMNKAELIRQFEKLRLFKCANFISKINDEF